MLILDLWGVSFHTAVVFGLGKDFLFKSALGHCARLHTYLFVCSHVICIYVRGCMCLGDVCVRLPTIAVIKNSGYVIHVCISLDRP